jgi:hypothetical protein
VSYQNENARDLEPEVAAAEFQATVEDVSRRLPPELELRLMKLQPGDAQAIVTLVRQYPDFADVIFQQAATRAGNHTLNQATEMLAAAPQQQAAAAAPAGGQARGYDTSLEGFDYRASVLTMEVADPIGLHVQFIRENPHLRSRVLNDVGRYNHAIFDDLLDHLRASEGVAKSGPTEKEITEAQDDGGSAKAEANSEAEGQERSARPQEETKEAAWVVGAKRFNAAHEEEVNEFNRVTKDACVDSDGVLDPALVSDWQARHGVQPDGRVGPATVDAARRAAGIGRPPGPMTAEDLASLE